ncbi:MAG: DUF4139 domain-containing protein [Lewinella sp.]|nr:DUF4139 domain-containing protein [Lewinella sp.]
MLKWTLGLCLSACVTLAAAQTTIATDIDAVTVYLQGAQVMRSGGGNLPAGRNTFVISELSPQLDPQSVRLSAKGDFTILSVTYRNNYLEERPTDDARISELERNKKALEAELASIGVELEVLQQEEELLLANKSIGGSQTGVSVDELQRMAEYLRTRLAALKQERLTVLTRQRETKAELDKVNQQLQALGQVERRHVGEVVVQYQADSPLRTEVDLSYLTHNASWSPTYDLRVKDLAEPVELAYGAKVSQGTGENWQNVNLTLSTGNPRQRQDAPVLGVWWLRPYQEIAYRQQAPAAYMDGVELTNAIVTAEEVASDAEYAPTSVSVNLTNTEFNVQLAQDIPADGQPYQVRIDAYELPAHYEYYAAPRLDPHAYLTAGVTNWERYSLLPGPVNLYFDGAYIGRSQLRTQTATDTLTFSLGRDEGIVIKREQEEDYRNRRFLGTRIEQRLGWTIEVQKNRRNTVPIVIEEQIPVSTTDEITVELEQARGAQYDASTGKLRWELDLGFGESETVGFRFSVKHPRNMHLPL